MKKHVLFIIVVIAGLVAAKALLAKEPQLVADSSGKLHQMCANPVMGEFLVKLKKLDTEPNKLLRLNSRRMLEVATFGKAGERVNALNNIENQVLQNSFDSNNLTVTSVEPLQSMFVGGANFGRSAIGAKDLREEIDTPIVKIKVEKRQPSKGEPSFAYQNSELKRDYKANKRYTATSLQRLINYKRYLKTIYPILTQQTESEVAFIVPNCRGNVREASYSPSPPNPNDGTYLAGDNWGLKNWGIVGLNPIVDAELHYDDAWRMMYQVWRLLSPGRTVMSIVDGGLDDRMGGQNTDLVDVVSGSFVASGLGSNPYYTYTGSDHGLKVTGVALAGNNNSIGTIGFTTGSTFLAVVNDGTPVEDSDMVQGIQQAGLNSNIVNFSYGYIDTISTVAITDAIQNLPAGVVLVAGAGNSGLDLDNLPPGIELTVPVYPCALGLSNTLCVAGINSSGVLGTFGGGASSNHGITKVHVAAPAKDIKTTYPGGVWAFSSGTSFSAPHVSAMIAAVIDFRPSLTAVQVASLIKDPANNRTTLPGLLDVASRGIPDFKLVLDAAARLVPCGDMNSNGGIDALDALILARSIVGLIPHRDPVADDFSGDGVVNVNDALTIAQKAAGLPVVEACPGSRVD